MAPPLFTDGFQNLSSVNAEVYNFKILIGWHSFFLFSDNWCTTIAQSVVFDSWLLSSVKIFFCLIYLFLFLNTVKLNQNWPWKNSKNCCRRCCCLNWYCFFLVAPSTVLFLKKRRINNFSTLCVSSFIKFFFVDQSSVVIKCCLYIVG